MNGAKLKRPKQNYLKQTKQIGVSNSDGLQSIWSDKTSEKIFLAARSHFKVLGYHYCETLLGIKLDCYYNDS